MPVVIDMVITDISMYQNDALSMRAAHASKWGASIHLLGRFIVPVQHLQLPLNLVRQRVHLINLGLCVLR